MQLQRNIFLWVSLATVLPLTVLVWTATAYSERQYRRDVVGDINGNLNNVVAEVDRRLSFEREVLLGLSVSPAVRAIAPVLEHASWGALHPEFFPRINRLNNFLEAFQNTVPSLSTLRVLDIHGNTLVKVQNAEGRPALFDGIDSFPYAEEELEASEAHLRRLRELIPGEVGFMVLPQTRREREAHGDPAVPALLDAVVPLAQGQEIVGYLAASSRGSQIDRILDLAPRVHNGQVLIAELNPDEPGRDGEILYDEAAALRFADLKWAAEQLQELEGGRLWSAVHNEPYGVVSSSDGRASIYYMEYLPYPNRLVSWVVATRIDRQEITAPFSRIRLGIWLFAGVALVLSLGLTRLGTRMIAKPVVELARNLKAYANGNRRVRVNATSRVTDEIRQLESAFNYMADTLEQTEAERDRAQKMMLQNAKLASLGQMAAGVGHEINNPLNNILSLAKLIERDLPKDEHGARRDLAALREEALRASRIVSGVLNFARQVPPHVSRFELRDWLADTLALVEQDAKRRGVTLEWQADEAQSLAGDRSQLQQALINLLLNAIHATPRAGRVSVKAHRVGNEAVIAVRDEGPGIDAGVADRIFDPFFTTKPVGEGSGLGLSIALGIVEHHGGRLWVTNEAQGGATASIALPVTATRTEPTEIENV